MVEVDRVDLVEVDEGLDVDRARLARLAGASSSSVSTTCSPSSARSRADLLPVRPRCPPRSSSGAARSGVSSFSWSWRKCRSRSRAALDRLHRHVDQAEGERAVPERARHAQGSPPGSPEGGHRGRRCSSSGSGSSALDLLALRLALDQLEHRLAVAVLVVAPARTSLQSDSTSCPAISTSRLLGLFRGSAGRGRRPRTTSSWKRIVCSASTPSSGATATRYSRSWKLKRPIADPAGLARAPPGSTR